MDSVGETFGHEIFDPRLIKHLCHGITAFPVDVEIDLSLDTFGKDLLTDDGSVDKSQDAVAEYQSVHHLFSTVKVADCVPAV